MHHEFDFKFICKNKEQAQIILRQTLLPEYLKEILDSLKKLSNAQFFLNKVGKKEAPGYYDIIKNPMDLSTMTKKLHLYRNLEEFKQDIDLIISNCMAYNTAQYYWDCANDFKAEAYALLLKYQNIYPKDPMSYNAQGMHVVNDRKSDLKAALAKYFKIMGFERCEKKCIDILHDIVDSKIKEFVKSCTINMEN